MEYPGKTIFLVDDDIVNLSMGGDILSAHYNVFTANSGARLMKLLEEHTPDLILLDIAMPEMSGYDAIMLLKENEKTKYIPVIFLTAKSSGADELLGLSLGATDYIVKPFSPPLLLKRIEMHLLVESQKKELEAQKRELIKYNYNLQEMVEARTKTVNELQNAMMNTIADLIECRGVSTGDHIGRTQEYLRVLLYAIKDNPKYRTEAETWDTTLILQSAQLHDIGKIAISDSILNKPGKLTSEEYEVIKTHVSFGESVIDRIIGIVSEHAFLSQAKIMISTHHERWDGSGYPKGLYGNAIPLQGRLMAIVDVYDALISNRPYKRAYSHRDVVRVITEGKGIQFDPDIVDVFLCINETFEEITMISGARL